MALSCSTLSDWVGRCGVELTLLVEQLRVHLKAQPVLHADETPVSVLMPENKKPHKGQVWAYASTRYASIQGIVYDFCPSRSGKEVRRFLEGWQGKLVCDDYGGYKASFKGGVTEVGCWAHSRRKFHELNEATDSPIAKQALETIRLLYEVERESKDSEMDSIARQRLRQEKSKPLLDKFRQWLMGQREQVTNGTKTAKAIDYSLKRWEALVRYVDDGDLPIDKTGLRIKCGLGR